MSSITDWAARDAALVHHDRYGTTKT